jgi:hypothetical protein
MEGALIHTYRDEITGKTGDDTMGFMTFYPDWNTSDLWKQWTKYNTNLLKPSWVTLHLAFQHADNLSRKCG